MHRRTLITASVPAIFTLVLASTGGSVRSAGVPSRLTHPTQETTVTFGHSYEGRPLLATVLGSGPNVTIVFGGFHGNERSAPGVVERLRTYLEQHPEQWPGCRVILVPRANPDGVAAGTRTNARGVDINRNFPFQWAPASGRRNPGPRPASEPETQAIIRLMKDYHPSKVISIHQPLDSMNWTGERGRKLAGIMQRYDRYPITSDLGYPTPGSFGKYCGRGLQIAIVTLELPPISAPAAWDQNREALLAAIRCSV